MKNLRKPIILTFDQDWAPPFIMQNLIEHLHSRSYYETTFFATHCCPVLKEFSTKHPSMEIALHPNRYKTSETSELRAMKDELERYYQKDIVSSRFHRLYFEYRDLYNLCEIGIKNDSSILMHGCFDGMFFKSPPGLMNRLSYQFEDGTQEVEQFIFDYSAQGSLVNKFFCAAFHPLNLYLNSQHPEDRQKALDGVDDLVTISENHISKFRKQNEYGALFHLNQMLELAEIEFEPKTVRGFFGN